MSAAYKCDKCEQFKDGKPTFTIRWARAGNDSWATKEVCDDCGWAMCRSVSEQAEHRARIDEAQAGKEKAKK